MQFTIQGFSMFPTYSDGESINLKKFCSNHKINIGDIVVFNHPLRKNFKLLKRVKKLVGKDKLFVEGDNTDFLSSEDSHNFGLINRKAIIAIGENI
jgi:signal peptidase I